MQQIVLESVSLPVVLAHVLVFPLGSPSLKTGRPQALSAGYTTACW